MNRLTLLRPIAAAVAIAGLLPACSKTEPSPKAADAVVAAPAAAPSSGALASKLCAVLRSKAPELQGMSEVGARSQLVMAIATAFDVDAKALATVSSDIDAIASAGCPEVRAPLLAATRAASLQEAVR